MLPEDPQKAPHGACRLLVGTSGYSYGEWTDAGFYPPGTQAGDMLPIYARTFPITELNYTWYQMPKAPAVERMRQKSPPEFCFAAKLTRTLSHEVDPDGWRGQVVQYRDGIAPLLQARQLQAILVQLPPGFRRSPENRRYLAALLDELADLPVAVEFRHASWATDRVFAELERRRTTLVAVDEPDLPGLFPCLDVVTNPDLIYVRFHGRNTGGWRSGNMQKQFDYDYREDELKQWATGPIRNMAEQARQGVIFFNNHVRAQAPRNAVKLIELLVSMGLLNEMPKIQNRDKKEFARQLEARTRKFAVRIIRLSTTLPNTPEARAIRNQITKSGTSIGANYREANRSRSKADFRNKIKICESEASEAQYWLEVITEVGWLTWEQLKTDYDECSELLAIFTSISRK